MEGTSVNANLRNTLKLSVGTLGFLGLLIVAQAILASHNRRLDLTPQKKFTLTPRTQQVVTGLKKDVQALAFIHSDRPENFFIEDLLSRMAALSPHFSYQIAQDYNVEQLEPILRRFASSQAAFQVKRL